MTEPRERQVERALHGQRLADKFCEFNPYADRVILHNFVGCLAAQGCLIERGVTCEPPDRVVTEAMIDAVLREGFNAPAIYGENDRGYVLRILDAALRAEDAP